MKRTTPATPSTATVAPWGMRRVASATPSTAGMPRSRARDGLRARPVPGGADDAVLAAGRDLHERPVAAHHEAVGDDLTLSDGRAEAPRAGDEDIALGGAAQHAAGRARGDQALDQHGHS